MKLILRFTMLSITVLGCVGCDQITKLAAQSYLRGHSSVSLFDGNFNLVYAENAGTMLGIGSGLPESMRFFLFEVVIGALLVAAIVFILARPIHNVTLLASSMVIGGAAGNLVDRLVHNGSVIDFMLIKIGSLESGIFNVADLAIIFGTCVLCLSFMSPMGESK